MKKIRIYLNDGRVKIITLLQQIECSYTELVDAATGSGVLRTSAGQEKVKNYTHYEVI